MCQISCRKISNTAPELHPIPVVAPWHHIDIDFVGPILPPSTKGSQPLHFNNRRLFFKVGRGDTHCNEASVVAAALFKVVLNFEQQVEV